MLSNNNTIDIMDTNKDVHTPIDNNDINYYSMNITSDDEEENKYFMVNFFTSLLLIGICLKFGVSFYYMCRDRYNDSGTRIRDNLINHNLLKKTKIDTNNLQELLFQDCSICLDNFKNEETIITTPCLHYFHEKCLNLWLENNHNCPLCRIDI